MFLFSYLLVSCLFSPCHVATPWWGFCYVAFFLLCVLYLKNNTKNTFFCTKNLHISKKSSTFAA